MSETITTHITRRLTICLPDNLSCFCARVRILVSFLGVRSVKSSAKGKKNDVRGGRHVRQVGRKLRPGCTPLYSLRRRAWLAGYVTRRIPRVAFFWHVQTYLIPILSR